MTREEAKTWASIPREEAEAARERVRAALNGEQTVSKTEKVESLDGKPLTAIEAYSVRQLRKSAEPTNTNFFMLSKNEFDFLLALRAMMKENTSAGK